MGVLSRAGVLPATFGGLVAFGAGVGIGTEICNLLGISGCFSLTSDGTDPSIAGSGGEWLYDANLVSGPVETDLQWYWHTGSGTAAKLGAYGFEWSSSECSTPTPPGTTRFGAPFGPDAGCKGQHSPGTWYAMRSALAGRTIGYSPTNTALPDTSYTAPSNWSAKLAGQIAGHTGDPAARLGEHVASEVPGSTVKDPYATYVDVPDCVGVKLPVCLEEVEELELVPKVKELDWDKAVIEELDELDPEKTREEESEKIIEVLPPPGFNVETGSELVITSNPAEEDMPEFVPRPDEGETGEEYRERKVPFIPFWHSEELDDAYLDPDKGPGEIVSTDPEIGTRLDPHAENELNVKVNPADAPAPAPAWSPPAISSIDMEPISGVPSPCSAFPFGLFCWMGDALAQFNTTGTCPHFSAPVAGTGSDFAVTLCGETAETIMGYLRPALLLAFIVGCGVMFARGTRAVGGD